MTNQFTEYEFKYNADNVGLNEFKSLMEMVGYKKSFDVSSWDHYYVKDGSDDFIRYRKSPYSPELTIKRKTTQNNNWKRVEIDLPLDIKRVNETIIEEFVGLEGYKENFKIYKSCFMFFQDNVNYVYYIVYDREMREKNRFIEVEINKDRLENWNWDVGSPENVLSDAERLLSTLGITNRNRLKKSLFELYRR